MNESSEFFHSGDDLIDKTFQEFLTLFPSSEHCLDFVFDLMRRRGQACDCGEPINIARKRRVKCAACGRLNWVTAKSLFHGMKNRPDVWVAIIFFHLRGVLVSANRLTKLLGASLCCVLNARAKIQLALKTFMEEGGVIGFPSSNLRVVYSRRSIETPARMHPEFEQDAQEKREAKENQPDRPGTFRADRVEIKGLLERFVSITKLRWKGVSRKYVQLYLVSFWCHVFHEQISSDAMLSVLARHRYISDDELMAFVSPLRLVFGERAAAA